MTSIFRLLQGFGFEAMTAKPAQIARQLFIELCLNDEPNLMSFMADYLSQPHVLEVGLTPDPAWRDPDSLSAFPLYRGMKAAWRAMVRSEDPEADECAAVAVIAACGCITYPYAAARLAAGEFLGGDIVDTISQWSNRLAQPPLEQLRKIDPVMADLVQCGLLPGEPSPLDPAQVQRLRSAASISAFAVQVAHGSRK